MTEQQQQPAQQDPPTTYRHPEFHRDQWPPLSGGPGIPPSERKGFVKKHGLTLGLTAVAVIVAGSLGVGIGRASVGTPQACIEAIDLANQGFGLAGDALDYAQDGVEAAGDRNYTALGRAGDGMEEVADEMGTLSPKWKAAQESCTGEKA